MKIAVIGSGYGGAVAVSQLAQAGKDVDLIEMGVDWENMPPVQGKIFTKMVEPTERSMWFKTKTQLPFGKIFNLEIIDKPIKAAAGVLDVEQFEAMRVYLGRGVGGGSLVNGGMAVVPSRSYFEKIMPQVDAQEMYDRYFPQAQKALGVNLPPNDILGTSKFYKFARVGAQDALKAGYKVVPVPNVYDWEYMRQEDFGNVERSGLGGQVIFGNDYGKKSLSKTILKEVFKSEKVNLLALTEVTSIARDNQQKFVFTLKTIDFWGNTVEVQERTYDRLIMAAGSVGTSKLLLKAKAEGGLKQLPAEIGKSWGPNGNIMAARKAGKETGKFQSGIPALGVTNWDDSEESVFAEVAPFPAGIELKTNLYLAITNNPRLAEFTWDADKNELSLSWKSDHAKASVQAAEKFLTKINEANPGSSFRKDLFDDGKIFSDYFSYHPLGGAILGEATDLNGEVKGEEGLFIVDSSLIPGRIGVNPFVTITALATRNMEKLIQAGKFEDA
ncbi:GMC oxidoreductase [uncultured Rothia sp.]|uniref:GMC oxidoreductase n=1 Tax=uncultured Rothia sp. TaxID=316088 RepID=UPI003216B6F3